MRKRFIAVLLTLVLLLSNVNVYAFAQEIEASAAEINLATVEPTVEPASAAEPVVPEATEVPVEATPEAAEAPVEATPEATDAPVEATPEATEAPVEATPEATEAPVEATPEATEAPVEATPEATVDPEMMDDGIALFGMNSSSTVDHIDIGCKNLKAVIDGETVNFSFTSSDVRNGNIEVYIDGKKTTNTSGSSTDANGLSQVRMDGTFSVNQRHTVEIRKYLTNSKGVTAQVIMSVTAYYFDYANNKCPPLWQDGKPNSQWKNGQVVSGSGIDIELDSASTNYAQLQVTKVLSGISAGTAGREFKFKLYKEGTSTAIQEFTIELKNGATQASYVFTAIEPGTYYVVEDTDNAKVDGYKLNVSYSGNATVTYGSKPVITVTNTYQEDSVSISGSKTWVDNNDNDGKRPASITVNLLANGTKVASKTVTANDGWAWMFSDMPKYANGNEINYTVTEEAVEGYTATVNGYNITNTHTPEKTEVAGSKTWNDDNNRDGIRPEKITVNLLANGKKVDSKDVTASDNWTWSFTDLLKYEDGKAIVYTVTEETVAGYTATVNGYDITNTHTPEKTEVAGSKTWNDDNNRDGIRPEKITVNLLANGKKVDSKNVSASDNWTWSFTDLLKYEDGNEITYTVTEETVAGYTATINGYDITNSHTPEKTEVAGSKSWNDDNNRDGIRPEKITVNLLANGKKVDSKNVSASNNWAWSFTDLLKYEDGKEIVYTVTEEAVEDYITVINGYNITNSHTPEKTSVDGSKTWNDDNNRDGIRPEKITVNLLANGKKVDSKDVTASDNWTWSFTGLLKYEDGKEIVYTVTEETVEGYTAAINGYDITNSHTPEKTSVDGSKTWNDDNNRDGIRPEKITVNLLANGKKVDSKDVTEADNWAWSFTGLLKYEDGKAIVYTVTEEAVDGYTAEYAGYNITNTHTPEKINVDGSKTWNDDSNRDGIRPEKITVNLLANGTKVDSKSVSANDNWAWSFTGLLKYEDGKEITYTVTEEAVEGYTSTVNGYNITNSHTPEKTEVAGSKTWNDDNNRDGIRPEKITVNLLANGKKVDSKDVTASDNWTWSFTDLLKYEDGKAIVYTVTEEAVAGYTAAINGYNITNSHTPEKTEVAGSKTWNDDNNRDGIRPEKITVNLLANGKKVDSKDVTANDNWAWSFTDLLKYEDGKEIVYTVTEETVAGYTATVNGYNITNTHTPETINISGRKIWVDKDNKEGKRPEKITINLLADGQNYITIAVTEANGWSWTFNDLPKYNEGKEIVYALTEDYVKDYTREVEGFNVINTLVPDEDEVPKTGDLRADLQNNLLLAAAALLLVATLMGVIAKKRENN